MNKKIKFKKKQVDNSENVSLKSNQSGNTIYSKNDNNNNSNNNTNKLIIDDSKENTSKLKLFKVIFDNIIKKNMIITQQNKTMILSELVQKYPIYFSGIEMSVFEIYEMIEKIVVNYDIQNISNANFDFDNIDLGEKSHSFDLFQKYNEIDKNNNYIISDRMLKSIYSCCYDKVNEVLKSFTQ